MKEKVNVSLLVHDLSTAPRSLQKRFNAKHNILLAAMKDVDNTCFQTLASNSGVHLLLAALCRANGVDLNTVNH